MKAPEDYIGKIVWFKNDDWRPRGYYIIIKCDDVLRYYYFDRTTRMDYVVFQYRIENGNVVVL